MSEFCVMVSSQLNMPCDGRIGVAEHKDIEFGITGKDIFHPVTVHMESQTDIPDLVILCLEGDFVGKPVRNCLFQHLHIAGTGIKRIQVFAEIRFPLGTVSVSIDAGTQVVQLHLGAVPDIDAGNPDGGIKEQEGYQHNNTCNKETGKIRNIPALIPQFVAGALDKMFHEYLLISNNAR